MTPPEPKHKASRLQPPVPPRSDPGLIRQCRAGQLNDPRSFTRMKREGPIAEQIAQTHKLFRKRSNLDRPLPPFDREAFATSRRERAGVQRGPFE